MQTRTLAWVTFFVLLAALTLRVKQLRPGEGVTLQREQAAYQYVRDIIKDRYVREVDERKLFYGAMDGMASSLDPFSRFLSPEQFESLRTATTGLLEGVGIEWDSDAEGIVVLTPLQDSPAWFGGVYPGDRILKINGIAVDGQNLDDVTQRIRGPAGTKVKLTLQHKDSGVPVDVELERAVFEIPSIPVAEMVGVEWLGGKPHKLGYVQIAQFQENTTKDLDAALTELEGHGMQALILDLRQNPGGLLEAAEGVADLFLKDGEIVTVLNREARKAGSPGNVTYAKAEGTHPDYPVAVLVDGQSASAAEIVSGALKDRGRAVLVGDRTYGKFSVQDILRVELENWGESALKLTIARYKTPRSPCIDGQGLDPDLPVPFTSEQLRGMLNARRDRHVHDNDPRNKDSKDRSRNGGKGPAPARRELIEKIEQEKAKAKGEGEAPFVDLQMKKAIEWLTERLASGK